MMKALKQVSVGIYHSLPVGGINWGMKAYERGYLRARAEISADKDGDIFGQKRR